MSKAQVSRTVKFLGKAGTFTAMLQSSRGQLWQSYTGDADAPASVTPDYNSMADKPVIRFVVVSSLTAGNSSPVASTPKWFFGAAQINTASINAVDKAYEDYFELVAADPASSQPYYGLRIKQNLVALAGGTSVNIRAVGEVAAAGLSAEVTASTSVNIYPQTGSALHVDVQDVTAVADGVTGRNFTFTADSQTITLRAETWRGSVRLDEDAAQAAANCKYQWQKVADGAWTDITDATAQTYTVTEKDVMTYAKLRVKVTVGEAAVYGTASIMDATDPYIIDPMPVRTRAGSTLGEEGVEVIENEGDVVTYTPRVVRRSAESTNASGQTDKDGQPFMFNFLFYASDGVMVKQVAGASQGTVDYDMCFNSGNIEVLIETVQDLEDW